MSCAWLLFETRKPRPGTDRSAVRFFLQAGRAGHSGLDARVSLPEDVLPAPHLLDLRHQLVAAGVHPVIHVVVPLGFDVDLTGDRFDKELRSDGVQGPAHTRPDCAKAGLVERVDELGGKGLAQDALAEQMVFHKGEKGR